MEESCKNRFSLKKLYFCCSDCVFTLKKTSFPTEVKEVFSNALCSIKQFKNVKHKTSFQQFKMCLYKFLRDLTPPTPCHNRVLPSTHWGLTVPPDPQLYFIAYTVFTL